MSPVNNINLLVHLSVGSSELMREVQHALNDVQRNK